MKMPNVSKLLTLQNLVILVVVLLLAYALYVYSSDKTLVTELMEDGEEGPVVENPEPVPDAGNPNGIAYAQKPVANPSELLPKDTNSKWGELNTVNQSNIAMPDLLQAGYHIGLDTVGQTLRNANLQLRSDPVINKSNVGPWHNSTIEPDLARVPLELGAK